PPMSIPTTVLTRERIRSRGAPSRHGVRDRLQPWPLPVQPRLELLVAQRAEPCAPGLLRGQVDVREGLLEAVELVPAREDLREATFELFVRQQTASRLVPERVHDPPLDELRRHVRLAVDLRVGDVVPAHRVSLLPTRQAGNAKWP